MSAFCISSAVLFLVLLASIPSARSYPYGAGACNGGGPAVGGDHLTQPLSGSLDVGGYQVTLDSIPLTVGVPANFIVGQDHVLSVTASSTFRGILFRLGNDGTLDTSGALSLQSGDSTLHLASDVCGAYKVGGITHSSASDKTMSSVTLRLNTAAENLPLDITVVKRLTTYYYSGYTLNAVTTAVNPTTAPVAPSPQPIAPTPQPIAPAPQPIAPTPQPIAPVALAPVVAPVAPVPVTPTPVAPTSVVTPMAPPSAAPVPVPQPVAAPSTPVVVTLGSPIGPTHHDESEGYHHNYGHYSTDFRDGHHGHHGD